MPWITASLLSAFFLGCYDLSTKHAVRENAVLPVLFFTNLCSATVWLGLMAFAAWRPGVLPAAFVVAPLPGSGHLLLLLKSSLVAVVWTLSYFAVKHLPISLAAPVRATGPLWTLLGAVTLLGERPTWIQSLGIVIILGSFLGLSAAGSHEGIHFHRNRWIWLLVGGTLLNGVSALYDKFLLGRHGFAPSTVQAWFSIYLAALFLPLAIGWKRRWWPRHEFHWRGSIITMSLGLLIADFVYFGALRDPHALVAVVSSFRRGSTLVAFAGGVLLFHEANWRRKLPAVAGIVAGIVLTVLG